MTASSEKLARHLSQPENRIRYCLAFVDAFTADTDDEFTEQAMSAALYWISQATDPEAHF